MPARSFRRTLRRKPPAEATRPKVSLVLSGGSARGATHVGVPKVLEALRVPIDCITATSVR